METNRRKNILINKGFQIKLIIKFLILNFILIGTFASVFYFFFKTRLSDSSTPHFETTLINGIIIVSFIDIFISSIIIIFVILIASHKLAGPIYRFRKALQQMSDKNFNIFTDLRYGDQYYPCSEEISRLRDSLSADINSIKEKLEKIKQDTNNNSIVSKKSISLIDELIEQINQYNLNNSLHK